MVIADIITELKKVSTPDLLQALFGVRNTFRVFPAELQKEMLGQYSDTEYAILSALRSQEYKDNQPESIYDIYKQGGA